MTLDDHLEPVTAAAVLGLLPNRPRVLALGEPTHGEDVLLEVRNELFRELAAHGYRTIAIESDCLRGLLVDDHVTSGKGTLDDVMAQGFSHGFGDSAANRELVRWMRDHNADRPAAEHVRFAGFDGPLEISGAESPRRAVTALHAYVSSRVDPDLLPCTAETLDGLLGADERWTHPSVMTEPSASPGRTAEARELRLLTDDLVAVLDASAPRLADEPGEWERARLYARTATGLLRYHHGLAGTSPGRLPGLLGLRDSMMADNLLALAGRGPVLAYAHNSHLQRHRSSMRLWNQPPPLHWWSAGAITAAHLGDGYAFVATALGTIHHHGVGVPPDDTAEGHLYARARDRVLADPRGFGEVRLVPRVSEWFGYAPLDPAHLGGLDGLVFVPDSPPKAQR